MSFIPSYEMIGYVCPSGLCSSPFVSFSVSPFIIRKSLHGIFIRVQRIFVAVCPLEYWKKNDEIIKVITTVKNGHTRIHHTHIRRCNYKIIFDRFSTVFNKNVFKHTFSWHSLSFVVVIQPIRTIITNQLNNNNYLSSNC